LEALLPLHVSLLEPLGEIISDALLDLVDEKFGVGIH
jgi:hypothetical protein